MKHVNEGSVFYMFLRTELRRTGKVSLFQHLVLPPLKKMFNYGRNSTCLIFFNKMKIPKIKKKKKTKINK